MLFLVNDFLLFVSLCYVYALAIKFHSYNFIKFNIYPEENILIYSSMVRNNLICSRYCIKIENCTMIMMKTIETDHRQQICYLYHVIVYNNITLVNEHGLEIWYKIIPKGNEEADVEGDCPSGFTQFQEGCFHASSTPSNNWEDAHAHCTDFVHVVNPNSQLAVFGGTEVSKIQVTLNMYF